LYSPTKQLDNKLRAEFSMKVLVSVMIITIGALVFFIVGNDTDIQIDSKVSQQKSFNANNLAHNDDLPLKNNEASLSKSEDKSSEPTKAVTKSAVSSSSDARPYYQKNYNYGDTGTSYNQGNSSYQSTESSRSLEDSGYGNARNSDSQSNPSYERTSTTSSSNSLTTNNNITDTDESNRDNIDQGDTNSEKAEDENTTDSQEDTNNAKYQRLYDNGIMWSGNTGMLMIEYQSSHAETTGLGFRVHFDSSAIKPINVQQFPVDALVTTTAQMVMPDSNNRDNNINTDQVLTFAWVNMYGQWPQTNQVTLATIEFERVDGGSSNDVINYSATSTPAGFRFIK
jgi:hypothetical protein